MDGFEERSSLGLRSGEHSQDPPKQAMQQSQNTVDDALDRSEHVHPWYTDLLAHGLVSFLRIGRRSCAFIHTYHILGVSLHVRSRWRKSVLWNRILCDAQAKESCAILRRILTVNHDASICYRETARRCPNVPRHCGVATTQNRKHLAPWRRRARETNGGDRGAAVRSLWRLFTWGVRTTS